MSAISVKGLSHKYGKRVVLDSIDLQIQPGEFYGFLGQNGAGKSTAIRAMCGFITPDSGEISVAGVDVIRNSIEVRSQVGTLSEDIVLYERLTGREALEFTGRMHGLSDSVSRLRCGDLLERLELEGAADRMISGYSLGMKKKTAFAAALIHSPKALFLDEPFNGIDAHSTRTLCSMLQWLCRERGVAVLFTSHVLEMAERLCDRVAILHAGRIQAEGTVSELKRSAIEQGKSLEDIFLELTGSEKELEPALSWY